MNGICFTCGRYDPMGNPIICPACVKRLGSKRMRTT